MWENIIVNLITDLCIDIYFSFQQLCLIFTPTIYLYVCCICTEPLRVKSLAHGPSSAKLAPLGFTLTIFKSVVQHLSYSVCGAVS